MQPPYLVYERGCGHKMLYPLQGETMRCVYCLDPDTRVVDSRESDAVTRRRRECISCSKRFTTYERIEGVPLSIVKKDGRKEPFDREKLRRGITCACEKTSVTTEAISELIDKVEARLMRLSSTDIPSKKVGEVAMRYLRTLDKVAYIRFASVYREFAELEDFHAELQKLIAKQKK